MKPLLTVIAFVTTCVIANAQPAFITDSLDNYLQREMQRWNIPGMALTIVKDGEVLISKGYGVRDLDTKLPVDENTLFQIASNTKAFTGTALALLQEQGDLQLDDKVVDYLDYFHMPDPGLTQLVTIEDVVSHRLGFETFEGDFLHWNSDLTRRQMVESIANQEMVFDFRDTYGYCNVGFVAAGEIIHLVSDTTWDDYIRNRLFTPLEMHRSSTTIDALRRDSNKCTPYTMADNALIKIDYADIDNLGPAASINSSVHDLSHWLLMQLQEGKYKDRQVVPYKALRNTYSSRCIVGDIYSGLYPGKHFNTYGLGWFIGDYNGRRMLWHYGGTNGFVTAVCIIPEENLGFAILTNTDANSLYDALMMQLTEAFSEMPYRNISAIYHAYFQSENERIWQEIHQWQALAAMANPPELPLAAYAGTYHNRLYGDIQIEVSAGKLEVRFPHHSFLTAVLEPLGGNTFLCTYSDPIYGVKQVSFAKEQNKISSITLTVNDFVDMQPYMFNRK